MKMHKHMVEEHASSLFGHSVTQKGFFSVRPCLVGIEKFHFTYIPPSQPASVVSGVTCANTHLIKNPLLKIIALTFCEASSQ